MNPDYNNERGIEMLKMKIPALMEPRSHLSADAVLSVALETYGTRVGIMPVNGALSAKKVSEIVAATAAEAKTAEELRSMLSQLDEIIFQSDGVAQSFRLSDSDDRGVGFSNEAEFDGETAELHAQMSDERQGVDTEVVTITSNGVTKRLVVDSMDMITYMEDEDLSNEGRRAIGYLPADFDSTDMLSNTEVVKVAGRNIGGYGYDSDGELYIACPDCNGQDCVPCGAGTYMCLTCEDSVFDVDLLLSDLIPEIE